MPRVSEIADDFAERFGIEPQRARHIARTLRECGKLTTGARGRNAPAATSLDAARLLIGMMLVWRPVARTCLDVERIGNWTTRNEGNFRTSKHFDTFEQGLANLFNEVSKYQSHGVIPYGISVSISPAVGSARIDIFPTDDHSIEGSNLDAESIKDMWPNLESYVFINKKLGEIDYTSDTEILAIRHLLKDQSTEYYADFRTGFNLTPEVGCKEIFAVSKVVAGEKPLGWKLPE
jgi:hypothetical protein